MPRNGLGPPADMRSTAIDKARITWPLRDNGRMYSAWSIIREFIVRRLRLADPLAWMQLLRDTVGQYAAVGSQVALPMFMYSIQPKKLRLTSCNSYQTTR